MNANIIVNTFSGIYLEDFQKSMFELHPVPSQVEICLESEESYFHAY